MRGGKKSRSIYRLDRIGLAWENLRSLCRPASHLVRKLTACLLKSIEQPMSSSFAARWLLHNPCALWLTVRCIEKPSPQVSLDPSFRRGRPCDGSEEILGVNFNLEQSCSVCVSARTTSTVSSARGIMVSLLRGCHQAAHPKTSRCGLLLLSFVAPFFCRTGDTAGEHCHTLRSIVSSASAPSARHLGQRPS